MAKVYTIRINVEHVVDVVADTEEEASELAYDQFIDDAGFWDYWDDNIEAVEDL